MINSVIEVGHKIVSWIDYIVPATLIIISIFITALGIKSYKRLISDAKQITSSIPGVIFFLALACGSLFLWFYIRNQF